MTPQELKNSIMQLAIQGKLVDQRPEEGTGEELYQQIQAEKAKLIKDGKIKKQKPLSEITEDEKPFEIPESWMWIRLREAVYNRDQITPTETFSYIDIGSIDNVHQTLNSTENIITAEKAPSRARKPVIEGDILYSTVRPYLHNQCIVDRKFNYMPIASTGFAAMVCYRGIYNKFLFYYLLSPEFDKYANDRENAKGVAYPAINDQRLYRAVIVLPPLAEQKRIVAKIEELLPLVDRYEQAWTKLEDFNKRFPEDMKKSILQLAIQGKLVEQRQEEGTGEELYEQIQTEKQKLIKEGKIKKEKAQSEIAEEEIPFDIPESWKWVRFSDVIDVRDGTHDTPGYVQSGIPLVTSKNLVDGKIDFDTTKMISQKDAQQINQRSAVDNGDILFAMIGTIGNPVLVKKDREFCIKNMALFKPVDSTKFDMEYFLLFLQNEQSIMKKKASGGVQSFVSLKFLRSYLLPLPPYLEQRRIVAKLKELLPLCEKLK